MSTRERAHSVRDRTMNSTRQEHAGTRRGHGLTDRELSTSVLCLSGIYAAFLFAVIIMNLGWL